MGTRGVYGFRVNDQDKVTYNHFDSYPEGLGRKILTYASQTPISEMQKAASRIILVDERMPAPPDLIERYIHYADLGVSRQRYDDWYCLLRKTHGDLTPYHRDLEHMIDSHEFLHDSLFCEWAYIVNLDDENLEVYRGFNTDRAAAGRYAGFAIPDNDGYFGVALINQTPLEGIRPGSIDELVKRFGAVEICEM